MLAEFSRRHTRWRLAVLALLAVGCYPDRVGSPIAAPATPQRSVNDPPPPPQSITVTIPIPPTNLGGAAVSISPIPIQPYQPYMVTVSGRVNVASNPAAACQSTYLPPYGAEGSYGPGGTGGAWGSLRVSATGVPVDEGGPSGASEAKSDTLAGYSYPTDVNASRSALFYETGGGACPPTGFYLLSGSQTLTVAFLHGIELNLDPKAVFVKKGTKVTFTARSRGTIVGGPMWQFTKSDSLPDQTSRCSTNPCEVTVMNSGTLRATAWLYGRWRSDAAAIRVYSSLTLEADRSRVKYGDTVTFTPKIDGLPGAADRWSWKANDLTQVADPCIAIVSGKCKYAPAKPGTMWAYTANGDSARADVDVFCPTNNPLLDDPAIRKAFKSLIDSSGPDLAPGAGLYDSTSVGKKREHAGNIYRRPDGTFYFVEDTLAIGTECQTGRVPATTPVSSPDVLLAMIHTHPTATGKKVYGCPPDPENGLPRQRGPWDTSTPLFGRKEPDSTGGGGSIPDWNALRDHPANQVPYPQVPPVDGYVINADGEVWHLTSLDAFRPSDQKNNRRVYRYKGNSNPSCNWTS